MSSPGGFLAAVVGRFFVYRLINNNIIATPSQYGFSVA
jgi:hypothetical protein